MAFDGGRGGASARLALWYGAISLAIMMLHNVFVVFYVEEYVNAFGERTWAFYVGQAIFLVWNAVNDPLLGWLEDRAGLARSSAARSRTSDSIVARRARALRLAGPAYAASFALVWFRWLPLAVQFPLCLCLYDGFWTFVDLNNKGALSVLFS